MTVESDKAFAVGRALSPADLPTLTSVSWPLSGESGWAFSIQIFCQNTVDPSTRALRNSKRREARNLVLFKPSGILVKSTIEFVGIIYYSCTLYFIFKTNQKERKFFWIKSRTVLLGENIKNISLNRKRLFLSINCDSNDSFIFWSIRWISQIPNTKTHFFITFDFFVHFKKENFFLLLFSFPPWSKCIKKSSNFHLHNKKYFGF